MYISSTSVMVTGGAGFIGSALVRELLREKANVIVYDNFSSGDLSNLKELRDSIKIVQGDVLDSKFEKVLKENAVELVFHLAAEPFIPYCYYRPRKFFEVNASGTLKVLLACKKVGVKRVLYYSTSEVYGTAKYVPMDEEHPTNPLSTYAVSKLAGDRLCYTLCHEQGIPVTILRQFNAYGPRETQPYVIPELISQMSKTNKLTLGNIKARRDFTYVEDAALAAISLVKCDEAVGEVFNVGSGLDYSVEELARMTANLMGLDSIEIATESQRLRRLDVERLQCDNSKVQEFIAWEPRVGLKEGLERTIVWFRQHNNRWIWETKISPEHELWKKR